MGCGLFPLCALILSPFLDVHKESAVTHTSVCVLEFIEFLGRRRGFISLLKALVNVHKNSFFDLMITQR